MLQVRQKSLDTLRAVAVFMVLGRHILSIPEDLPALPAIIFNGWREVGWIGVDLFFVLSGFLVSGLFFSEYKSRGTIRPWRFLARRGFKIYPPFYVFLALTALISFFFNFPFPFRSKELVIESLFIQNYIPGFWNHTWSLAVEEHFYLFVALLMTILTKITNRQVNPFRPLPMIVLGICICGGIGRCIVAWQHAAGTWSAVLPFTHLRIDSLLFGVLLSYCNAFHRPNLLAFRHRFYFPLIALCLIALLLPVVLPLDQSRFMYTWGLSVLYVGSGALILLRLSSENLSSDNQHWTKRSLHEIGRCSYSIYLYHMPAYFCAGLLMQDSGLGNFGFYSHVGLYLFLSLFGGIMASRIIEKPFLKARDKYFP
jgi:peptidoglycan/LPS O-acetylase OafA/YrhL